MATTLDFYMPYDSGAGSNVSEDGWRSFAKHWRGDGVIRNAGGEFAVFGDSTGMQVKVPAGECWIQGNWGSTTTQRTLAIAAAHATLTRLDLVILRNDFVNNRIELDVLTGTAGSGVFPTVTQNTSKWEIQLGKVTVDPAAVTIAAGKVIKIQRFTDGSCRYTVDSSFQIVPTGTDTKIDFDVSTFDSSEVDRPTINQFKLIRPGFWLIIFNLYWDNPNTTGHREAWIQRTGVPGNRLGYDRRSAPPTGGTAINTVAGDRFTANTIIEAWGSHGAGVNVSVLGTTAYTEGTSITLWWMGP